MTSSDPEKIPFIISEAFLLFSREKNNHVLLKDRVCVCAWVCVYVSMPAHTSTPVSTSAGLTLASPKDQSADSSLREKMVGVGRERARRDQVTIFSFPLPPGSNMQP